MWKSKLLMEMIRQNGLSNKFALEVPGIISEIDNGNANTILATFGTTTDALLDVLSGKFNPTGKMPFAIPASREAVLSNKADVPGNLEPEGYAVFKFNDGFSY